MKLLGTQSWYTIAWKHDMHEKWHKTMYSHFCELDILPVLAFCNATNFFPRLPFSDENNFFSQQRGFQINKEKTKKLF